MCCVAVVVVVVVTPYGGSVTVSVAVDVALPGTADKVESVSDGDITPSVVVLAVSAKVCIRVLVVCCVVVVMFVTPYGGSVTVSVAVDVALSGTAD